LSIGSVAYRDAARAWMERRLGVTTAPEEVAACVGTKEFVASLPHLLGQIDGRYAARDTVLHPGIAYPTYAMGAELAGCRAVEVPLDAHWQPDLYAIPQDDVRRARVLWLNAPSNPTGAVVDAAHFVGVIAWARARGIVVVSDECYVEFAPKPQTILAAGHDGVLALHSLSKRSNLAGMRVGFYAGDRTLVGALADLRREAGLIVPTPVQAAAVAVLGDDAHVLEQRARYERRADTLLSAFAPLGIVHDGGPMPFYLWLRSRDGGDGWDLAARFARAGVLVAPGATFGAAGASHVRLALVQPDDRIAELAERMRA
jgi:aspartate/methionine/tyrosine aminotransferase